MQQKIHAQTLFSIVEHKQPQKCGLIMFHHGSRYIFLGIPTLPIHAQNVCTHIIYLLHIKVAKWNILPSHPGPQSWVTLESPSIPPSHWDWLNGTHCDFKIRSDTMYFINHRWVIPDRLDKQSVYERKTCIQQWFVWDSFREAELKCVLVFIGERGFCTLFICSRIFIQ